MRFLPLMGCVATHGRRSTLTNTTGVEQLERDRCCSILSSPWRDRASASGVSAVSAVSAVHFGCFAMASGRLPLKIWCHPERRRCAWDDTIFSTSAARSLGRDTPQHCSVLSRAKRQEAARGNTCAPERACDSHKDTMGCREAACDASKMPAQDSQSRRLATWTALAPAMQSK
jgi:hypothetical protein